MKLQDDEDEQQFGNMKNYNQLTVVAAIFAAITLQMNIHASPTHTGFQGGPRQIEEHPELVRSNAQNANKNEAAELKNAAWTNSPRVKEAYPELSRGMTDRATMKKNHPVVLVNRALAASPRYREEYRTVINSQIDGE